MEQSELSFSETSEEEKGEKQQSSNKLIYVANVKTLFSFSPF